ncbi:hypothetical protein V3851_23130 [Paenibacillus sp. M1]|uniref:Uncharacterized protein n=1 Tax=Paenibacillus haidiansis TaxID=1574488 RepID=A0ABU7W0L4_9BACL
MSKLKKYWLDPACEEVARIQARSGGGVFATRNMVTVAFLAALSAMLQSMGGLLPGVGFVISPFATAPIILASVLSAGSGIIAYFLTILLLLFIQPSELIVFPFTTGILALGIGISFMLLKSRLTALLAGCISLFAGILMLLYVFQFPVLGPALPSGFNLSVTVLLLGFSLLYAWVWVWFSKWMIRKLSKVI